MSGFLLCMTPSTNPDRLTYQRCPSIPRQVHTLFLLGGVSPKDDTLAHALARRAPADSIVSFPILDEESMRAIQMAWQESGPSDTVVVIAEGDLLLRLIRTIGTERCKSWLHYYKSLNGDVAIAMNEAEFQMQF